MEKILIIKTGQDETFTPSAVKTASLGDVLRTTVLLHLFPNSSIHWITSAKAAPLLTSNPQLHVHIEEEMQLPPEDYDLVINLEKSERWIQWLKNKPGGQNIGFVHPDGHWLDRAGKIRSPLELKNLAAPWPQGLYALVGESWRGEDYHYVNPRLSAVPIENDVGLNWMSGPKWPKKMWPQKNWEELSMALKQKGFSVSWQKGFNDLNAYARWIAGCRFVVTIDSLGLHLALALKKRVLALFGPTSPEEVYFYERGVYLAPCLDPKPLREITCMENISVNNAVEAFQELYEGSHLNDVGKKQNFSPKRI